MRDPEEDDDSDLEDSDLEEWDEDDYFENDQCDECGGEGFVEYIDCPAAWGEDCPSEVNHLVTCPYCQGTGKTHD